MVVLQCRHMSDKRIEKPGLAGHHLPSDLKIKTTNCESCSHLRLSTLICWSCSHCWISYFFCMFLPLQSGSICFLDISLLGHLNLIQHFPSSSSKLQTPRLSPRSPQPQRAARSTFANLWNCSSFTSFDPLISSSAFAVSPCWVANVPKACKCCRMRSLATSNSGCFRAFSWRKRAMDSNFLWCNQNRQKCMPYWKVGGRCEGSLSTLQPKRQKTHLKLSKVCYCFSSLGYVWAGQRQATANNGVVNQGAISTPGPSKNQPNLAILQRDQGLKRHPEV